MKYSVFERVLCAGVLAFALGCGGDGASDGDDGAGNSGGSGGGTTARTGTTECAGLTCSAGQYCDNLLCINGCLSDDNCTSTQVCEKPPGDNEGSCQTTNTATKDCSGYVEKCVACGAPQAQCQQECEVVNAECTSCVVSTSGCGLEACESSCGL